MVPGYYSVNWFNKITVFHNRLILLMQTVSTPFSLMNQHCSIVTCIHEVSHIYYFCKGYPTRNWLGEPLVLNAYIWLMITLKRKGYIGRLYKWRWGDYSGSVARVLEKAPDAIWIRCFLHSQNMLPKRTDLILKNLIKTVNSTQYFSTSFVQRLYYSDIRWLSVRRALNSLVEFTHEIEKFPNETQSPLFGYFSDG